MNFKDTQFDIYRYTDCQNQSVDWACTLFIKWKITFYIFYIITTVYIVLIRCRHLQFCCQSHLCRCRRPIDLVLIPPAVTEFA